MKSNKELTLEIAKKYGHKWELQEHVITGTIWWKTAIQEALELKNKELLDFINEQRDNGNIGKHEFSPALCLSEIIKYLEKEE